MSLCQTDIQEKSSFLGEQKCTALYNEKDTFVLKKGKKMLDVLPQVRNEQKIDDHDFHFIMPVYFLLKV